MAITIQYQQSTGVITKLLQADRKGVRYLPQQQSGYTLTWIPDWLDLARDPTLISFYCVDVANLTDPVTLITKTVLTPTALPNPFRASAVEQCVIDFGAFTGEIMVEFAAADLVVEATISGADPVVHYTTTVAGTHTISIVNDPIYYFTPLTIEAK